MPIGRVADQRLVAARQLLRKPGHDRLPLGPVLLGLGLVATDDIALSRDLHLLDEELRLARVAFDVGVRGGLGNLAVLAVLGALSFGGLGLLIASRTRTIEGVSGIMNLVMMPMWVLSGVFFASSNFPDAMQPFIQALPLTALNDALRGVMNEGLPLRALWSDVAILMAWGAVPFAIVERICPVARMLPATSSCSAGATVLMPTRPLPAST